MTQWGVLLLCVYVTLGLSRPTRRKAGRIALVITIMVISAVMVSYHATRIAPAQPQNPTKIGAAKPTVEQLFQTSLAKAQLKAAGPGS